MSIVIEITTVTITPKVTARTLGENIDSPYSFVSFMVSYSVIIAAIPHKDTKDKNHPKTKYKTISTGIKINITFLLISTPTSDTYKIQSPNRLSKNTVFKLLNLLF